MNASRNIIIAVSTALLLALPAGAQAEGETLPTPIPDKCFNLAGDQPTVPQGLVGIYGYIRPTMLNDLDIDYIGEPVDCVVAAPGLAAAAHDPAVPFTGSATYWGSSRTRYVEAPVAAGSAPSSVSLASFALTSGDDGRFGWGGGKYERGATHYLKVAGPARVSGTVNGDHMVNLSPNITVMQTEGVTFSGGGGNDLLFGSKRADDTLNGGAGNDTLESSFGRSKTGRDKDKLMGGAGNDTLNAADGRGDDTLNCGAGRKDVAVADARDKVIGCETVQRV